MKKESTKVMSEKERKSERLKVLFEIDKLSPLCAHELYGRSENCKNCKEIAKLGEKMIGLSRKRKLPNTNIQDKSGARKDKNLGFSILDYLAAKNMKIVDNDFAASHGIHRSKFQRWKYKKLQEIERLKKLATY